MTHNHPSPLPDPATATLDALAAEGDDLECLVRGLDAEVWASPTPAAGWTVAHQIAHLAWTDEAASASLATPRRPGTDPLPATGAGSTRTRPGP